MFKRIIAIIGKETRELLRDPLYLGLALVVPMMIIIIMGEGMTLDVKNIPVAFYDRDRSAASREYIALLLIQSILNCLVYSTGKARQKN